MGKRPVAGQQLVGMAEGMPIVQDGAPGIPGFALVVSHHVGLDGAAAEHRVPQHVGLAVEQGLGVLLQVGEERLVADDRVLDHLGQARQVFLRRQGGQGVQADGHGLGLVEGAHHVLAQGMVHPGLPPHAAVHHGEQGGRHLDEGDSTHEDRGREARHVAHHAAAEGDHRGLAGVPMAEHEGEQLVDGLEVLLLLARLEEEDFRVAQDRAHLLEGGALVGPEVGVGDQDAAVGAARLFGDAVDMPAQVGLDVDGIGAVPELHAQGLQFLHLQSVDDAPGEHVMGHLLVGLELQVRHGVERRADREHLLDLGQLRVVVEVGEEGAAFLLAVDAFEDHLGRGLEAHQHPVGPDQVQGSRIGQGAPAEGGHHGPLAAQLLEGFHLQGPEGGLALFGEDGRNGLARLLLDELVQVEELPTQGRGREGADAALARGHEAGEIDVAGERQGHGVDP
jgi:hypothetical protein